VPRRASDEAGCRLAIGRSQRHGDSQLWTGVHNIPWHEGFAAFCQATIGSAAANGLSPGGSDVEVATPSVSGEVELDVDGEDLEAGARQTAKMADPCRPGTEEVNEHEKTHLPYRSWCRHCVLGRGREMPHQKTRNKHELP
jgi:hypothetical protein